MPIQYIAILKLAYIYYIPTFRKGSILPTHETDLLLYCSWISVMGSCFQICLSKS